MTKLIVNFISYIFDSVAFLFVLAGALYGWELGAQERYPFIAAVIGALAGFITAAVVLGIPMIALRMNENLEEIKKEILKINNNIAAKTVNFTDEK